MISLFDSVVVFTTWHGVLVLHLRLQRQLLIARRVWLLLQVQLEQENPLFQ